MDEKGCLKGESSFDLERVIDLAERVMGCQDMRSLSTEALPWIARSFESNGVFLYIAPPQPSAACFHQYGVAQDEAHDLENACRDLAGPSEDPLKARIPEHEGLSGMVLGYRICPLEVARDIHALLGIKPSASTSLTDPTIMPRLLRFLGHAIAIVHERMRTARQIAYFNTYLTVSSLLAKSMGLHELLETILYFCTEAVGAQEASVLFLDEDKKNFLFYQTEGASRLVLEGASFPADEGIAGAVLRSRKAEIIHDVQSDPRFYKKFDTESGVVTRNMIVVPLVAEEEPVGVLEMINKVGGAPFTEEDCLLLHFIAEEIAFAVRNAKIFEIVVDSYCKHRQGQDSCEGCKRPLGSWTPCVKFRETCCLH
ncbi:MAG: GAF domain-containing protein [Syntrophobacteraceae bacterium]